MIWNNLKKKKLINYIDNVLIIKYIMILLLPVHLVKVGGKPDLIWK